ncbi:MAG: hypothetical protein ACRC67_18305, partial [Inquilinus sp.]|uniref:hypothetical protein n=1 Tax=Inquilinus sp. TaxID=1932117 RepID=UPI003F3C483D
MTNAVRNVAIRLSLQDQQTVIRGLQALGTEGQGALNKIERAGAPASKGLLALNEVAGDLRGRIDDLSGRAGPLGRALSALGPMGIAAAAGIGAAIAALGILYTKGKEALAFADDIGDVATKLNLTAEQLQEIRFAFNGLLAPEQVDAGLTKFTQTIGLAEAGNKKALQSFKALHIELKDGSGRWKTNVEVLDDVADHIAALESPEEQLAIATKLFGDAGADMIEKLREGSPVFKEAADRLREMGGVISDDDVARAGALQQQLDDLAVVIKTQLTRGFLDAGPQIVEFTRIVGENLPRLMRAGADAVKWLSDNLTTLLEIASAAAGAIAGGLIGSALGPLGTIIGALIGSYAGMKLAVDGLEGSHDDLNEVQRTTKRLMDELNERSRNAAGLTRDEAIAQAELARQMAATNVERAKTLANEAAAARAAAQQVVREKTVDLGEDFAADKSVQFYVDPKAQRALDEAEARERETAFSLADAMEAFRLADTRVQEANSIPSRPDAPSNGIAPTVAGGVTPTPIGGTRNPRGLPTRLGSLGGDDGTGTKGDPYGAQKGDLEALITLQQKLNAAYLDCGVAAAKITRELDLQQKLNAISDKYTPEQKAAIEQRLRLLDEEQRRGKVLQQASDLDDQVSLAQREVELAGETEAVRTRELAVLRAKLELQKQGVDLGSIEAKQLLDRTAKLVETNMRGAEDKRNWEELGQYASSAVDRISEALTQMAVTNKDAAIDVQAVWAGVLSELQQGLWRLAVMNPLKNALGLNGGTELPTLGGAGGLLGKAFNWIGGLFGFGSTGPAITLPTSPGTIGVTPLPNAMGNAFDRHGVVDRPTIFRFANGGVGEMGEAGPEGIVPLIRLPSGKLGVGTDGGGGRGEKVKIEVIDQVGVKVQATETRDGRGGRRIEMVLADA